MRLTGMVLAVLLVCPWASADPSVVSISTFPQPSVTGCATRIAPVFNAQCDDPLPPLSTGSQQADQSATVNGAISVHDQAAGGSMIERRLAESSIAYETSYVVSDAGTSEVTVVIRFEINSSSGTAAGTGDLFLNGVAGTYATRSDRNPPCDDGSALELSGDTGGYVFDQQFPAGEYQASVTYACGSAHMAPGEIFGAKFTTRSFVETQSAQDAGDVQLDANLQEVDWRLS